jgi:hypothetical protein
MNESWKIRVERSFLQLQLHQRNRRVQWALKRLGVNKGVTVYKSERSTTKCVTIPSR